MEVTEQQVQSNLPSNFEARLTNSGVQIYNHDQTVGATINFGVEDGTRALQVDSWDGQTETIYEDQSQETETFFEYGWFEDILLEKEGFDTGARVESILEAGLNHAHQQDTKYHAAEALIDSAEEAYETLLEEDKNVTDFSLQSKPQKELGNANITYGKSSDLGTEKAKLGMAKYSTDFATSAAYIMGVVLLQDNSSKPRVSTGLSYKPGSRHHDTQKDSADMQLINEAQGIGDYDFLN